MELFQHSVYVPEIRVKRFQMISTPSRTTAIVNCTQMINGQVLTPE